MGGSYWVVLVTKKIVYIYKKDGSSLFLFYLLENSVHNINSFDSFFSFVKAERLLLFLCFKEFYLTNKFNFNLI